MLTALTVACAISSVAHADGTAECPGYNPPSNMTPLPPAPTQFPGALVGDLSVGDDGVARYAIPLVVPPGVGGLEPKLTIAYASNAGTGMLGTGFTIDSASSVHRCGSTLEDDGFARAVKLDLEDNYCIDGRRLWPVNEYLDQNFLITEYRTRPDDFVQVLGYRSPLDPNTDPYYFAARRPSGHTTYFGRTSASRATAAAGVVTKWMVDEVVDTHQNSMVYHYLRTDDPIDGHTRELLLDEILYGGNPTYNLAYARAIRFVYGRENAHYVGEKHFSVGVDVTPVAQKLLTEVQISSAGALARRYVMSYEMTDTHQAVLSEITVCAADQTCAEPIRFAWEGAQSPLSYLHGNNVFGADGPTIGDSLIWRLADFDGDGTPDVLSMEKVEDSDTTWRFRVAKNSGQWSAPWINTGGSLGHFETWAERALLIDSPEYDGALEVELADLNHDGKTDIIIDHPDLAGASTLVLLSTGTSFVQASSGVLSPYLARDTSYHPWDQAGWMIGDLTGDGVPDLVQCIEPIATQGSTNIEDNCERDIDFLAAPYFTGGVDGCRPSQAQWSVTPWTPGDIFGGPAISVPGLTGTSCRVLHENAAAILDFDGDGENELVVLQQGNVRNHFGYGWVTYQLDPRSSHWVRTELAASPPPLTAPGILFLPRVGQPDDAVLTKYQTYFPDLNGDGLPDLYTASDPSRVQIQRGDGTFVVRDDDYPMPAGYKPKDEDGPKVTQVDSWQRHGVLILDWDQDGRDDILLRDDHSTNTIPEEETNSSETTDAFFWTAYLSRGVDAAPVAEYSGVAQSSTTWVTTTWTGQQCYEVQNAGTDDPRDRHWECYDTYATDVSKTEMPGIAVADLDSDGRTDLVVGAYAHLNVHRPVRLSKVWTARNPLEGPVPFWNSLATEAAPTDPEFEPDVWLTYAPLIDPTVRNPDAAWPGYETYRKQFMDGCEYPRVCLVSNRAVVSGYSINNGKNDRRMYRMLYRDGRFDRVKGGLGFGLVMKDDWQRGELVVHQYDTNTRHPLWGDYLYAGSPVREWKLYRGTDDNPSANRNDVELVTKARSPILQESAAGASYFVVDDTVEETKEHGVVSDPTDYNELIQGFILRSERHTELRSRTTVQQHRFDDYGNPTEILRWVDGVDQIDRTTRAYSNDFALWQLGRIESETVCSATSQEEQCRTTELDYSPVNGDLVEVRRSPDLAEALLRTQYEHDVFGNVTRVIRDDNFGNHREECVSYDPSRTFPFAHANSLGHATYEIYDPVLAVPLATRDANGQVTQKRYDAHGNLVETRDPSGIVTHTDRFRTKTGGPTNNWWATYEIKSRTGEPQITTELDMYGRAVRTWTSHNEVTLLLSNGSPRTYTPTLVETEYDFFGQKVSETLPYVLGDPLGPSLRRVATYDHLGRVLSKIAPNQEPVYFTYDGDSVGTTTPGTEDFRAPTTWIVRDPAGRVVRSTDGKGNAIELTYGPFGQRRTAISADRHVTTWEYDPYGRNIRTWDPDRGERVYTYDGFDEIRTSVDAAGRLSTYEYDAAGRIVTRFSDHDLYTYEFDTAPNGIGKIARATGPDSVRTHTYDSYSRPDRVQLTTSDGRTFAARSFYDGLGRLARTQYPLGLNSSTTPFSVRYVYSSDGVLSEIRDASNYQLLWAQDASDAAGHVRRERFGSGAETSRDHDPATGMLTSIYTHLGPTVLQDLGYVWDARQNMRARVDRLQPSYRSETFRYDELDRLVCTDLLTCDAQSPSCGLGPSCILSVQYDDGGNITYKTDVGTYTYDHDHPHAVSSIEKKGTTRNYTYDATGYQTSRPGALDIAYDGVGLPRYYQVQSDEWVTFQYDEAGKRIRKTGATERIWYFDGLYERVERPTAGTTEVRYYVRAGGRTVAVVTESSGASGYDVRYAHTDALNSTETLSSASGAVQKLSYDAFGAPRNAVWGAPGPFTAAPSLTSEGYTGFELDRELDVTNAGGRTYDHRAGRFLQPDVYVTDKFVSQTWNPYSYVRNNPLSYVDPTGFSESPMYGDGFGTYFGSGPSEPGYGPIYAPGEGAANLGITAGLIFGFDPNGPTSQPGFQQLAQFTARADALVGNAGESLFTLAVIQGLTVAAPEVMVPALGVVGVLSGSQNIADGVQSGSALQTSWGVVEVAGGALGVYSSMSRQTVFALGGPDYASDVAAADRLVTELGAGMAEVRNTYDFSNGPPTLAMPIRTFETTVGDQTVHWDVFRGINETEVVGARGWMNQDHLIQAADRLLAEHAATGKEPNMIFNVSGRHGQPNGFFGEYDRSFYDADKTWFSQEKYGGRVETVHTDLMGGLEYRTNPGDVCLMGFCCASYNLEVHQTLITPP